MIAFGVTAPAFGCSE